MNIALGRQFYDALNGLDAQKSKEVHDAVGKLQRGLDVGLHKLESLPFHAFSVNRDAYRVIVKLEGDTMLVVHVGPHDKAYEWASRNRVRRVGSAIRIVPVLYEDPDEAAQSGEATGDGGATGPLAAIPEKWFRRIGITPPASAIFRQVPDDDALVDVALCCKTPVGQALIAFGTEPDELEGAVRDFERTSRAAEAASEATEETSFAEALKDPVNASAFWVPPPGEEVLSQALRGELDAWRIFLHPSQKRLVTLNGSGAYKVTGGPGTGKTVVALHRARFLAEELMADDPRPILLTTFSRALATQLEEMLAVVCSDKPELLERIEVRTLVEASQQVLRTAGKPATFLNGETQDLCWTEALEHAPGDFNLAFYQAEREHVIERLGQWTETLYLRQARKGRSVGLDRRKKRAVWKTIEAFEAAMTARGGGDTTSLAREATRLLRTGEVEQLWAAVVCDEVQDFGVSPLRMLAALTSTEPGLKEIRANALFLTGDGYQRLYSSPVSMAQCGIPIVGRSAILRLNYRTTEGIRSAAVELVKGVDIDDLDLEGKPELGTFDGYRSLRPGSTPERHKFADPTAEADFVAAQLAEHPETLTLILGRTRKYLEQLRDHLRSRGHEVPILERSERLDSTRGAVLATLHRSKGLEAPRVIVAGTQLVPMRWPGGDKAERKLWERRETCLLYVGMTRARDWCAVTGTN